MATYLITGKSKAGEGLISVSISGINQEQQLVEELDVVESVRVFIAGAPGVDRVVAQKYEQVITVI
ncbi:hypothetical protein [Streptomyces sp. NPDC059759]|uniref:hypothetical protein n=1 Tax=Streptomyces sp. NPDC059759 TaxID=3346936 RepID=UPI00365BE5BB